MVTCNINTTVNRNQSEDHSSPTLQDQLCSRWNVSQADERLRWPGSLHQRRPSQEGTWVQLEEDLTIPNNTCLILQNAHHMYVHQCKLYTYQWIFNNLLIVGVILWLQKWVSSKPCVLSCVCFFQERSLLKKKKNADHYCFVQCPAEYPYSTLPSSEDFESIFSLFSKDSIF